ncbi:CCA tRNA nucleotidyltransferase [Acetobacter vaccinii]|uniref:CCA tRNA nucleotidyltransferase n=1 Tax=Acetobacter vaccinii TaxID=2592655 RepID=A0A5C1YMS3_9PROT|nr:CCA tRNA nucleotidyltransferase [Acetobacter vaccinii]QEO16397.1 CCA tRNA nucleotidyltransferase [Acetobacter vaccinii]
MTDGLALLGQLPPQSQAAIRLLWQILPDARLVGGVVRDLLANRPITDVDMATPQPPEAVLHALQQAGVRAVPTGLEHGTVTAVIDAAPYEITTLRRDEETDGRHARVSWTADWQEDAQRRDFTINALSLDRAGGLHDYFGGQADLAAGHVRFVGDAVLRIQEDALRILRYFRFQARYGRGQPDGSALQAISSQVALLRGLSVERIWSELKRILAGPQVVETLHLMEQAGVLAEIMPGGASLARLERLVATGAPRDPLLLLVALAHQPRQVVQRLKVSRAESDFVQALLRCFTQEEKKLFAQGAGEALDDALRVLLSEEPRQVLLGRLWLAEGDDAPVMADGGASFRTVRACLEALETPEFPLAGRDVLAAGLPAGPQVGHMLGQVRQWWRAGGCRAGRVACLAQLAAVLHAQPH